MDVHVPRAITSALRSHGVDVRTAQEDGSAELPDSALLDRAMQLGRILFTQDTDFLTEAATRQSEGRVFSGIVFSKQSLSIGNCVSDLCLLGLATTPEECESRLLFLPL